MHEKPKRKNDDKPTGHYFNPYMQELAFILVLIAIVVIILIAVIEPHIEAAFHNMMPCLCTLQPVDI